MLYQKYRPQKFGELIGQDYIKEILLNAILQEKISHAYLFSGPRGTGKTTTARLLAKALNCLNPRKDGEPCGKCLNCEAIKRGNFMDLIEIDAASNRGIDDIRELRNKVMLATSQGKYKVYIIDEVHMLSKEAFNALLKTLEEPPSNVVFILATTEPYAVPETIISRCQRFDFKPLTASEIMQLLNHVVKSEKIKIDKEILQLISIYSQGSSRDALSFLQQINSLHKPITLDKAKHVLGVVDLGGLMRVFDALAQKDKLVLSLVKEELANGYSANHLINGLLKYLEDLIFIKNIGQAVSPITPEIQNKMKKQADLISNGDLACIFNLLIEARFMAKDLEAESLPLEMMLLKFIGSEEVDVQAVEKSEQLEKEEKVEEPKQIQKKEEVKELASKTSIPKEVKSSNLKIDEKDFSDSWDKVIIELKHFNHSISTFLNKSNVELVNNEILIETPFLLYQKILSQPKNNQKIHQVIHKIFHRPIPFQIFVKDSRGATEIKKAFGI
jgi:DNA polymerase-3 subunit gamma/tau